MVRKCKWCNHVIVTDGPEEFCDDGCKRVYESGYELPEPILGPKIGKAKKAKN